MRRFSYKPPMKFAPAFPHPVVLGYSRTCGRRTRRWRGSYCPSDTTSTSSNSRYGHPSSFCSGPQNITLLFLNPIVLNSVHFYSHTIKRKVFIECGSGDSIRFSCITILNVYAFVLLKCIRDLILKQEGPTGPRSLT